MKKAVIFDLDGTLLYTLGDLAFCTNSVLERYGYPVHAEEEYRWFVGDGAWNQVLRAMPLGTPEAEIRKVYEEYLALYARHALDRTQPYDGIEALLSQLKADGFALCVASNKPHARTQEVIRHFFPGIFDVVLGHREGMPVKPDPKIVWEALTMLGTDVQAAFYAGDTATDVHTAHNAGVYCAGVLWGFRTREELVSAGADVLCADPAALYNEIRRYFDRI